ncbi:hypothetical protein K501DRAFT_288455 [Backusella circina FSU 941]|nr:hypothetical protein K501DRAFT_288455 [Backusella circina FSU 941]
MAQDAWFLKQDKKRWFRIITLPIQVFPRQSGPKLEVGSPAIAPLWLLLFRLR